MVLVSWTASNQLWAMSWKKTELSRYIRFAGVRVLPCCVMALLVVCLGGNGETLIQDGREMLAAVRSIEENAMLTLKFPASAIINMSDIPLPPVSSAIKQCKLEFIGTQAAEGNALHSCACCETPRQLFSIGFLQDWRVFCMCVHNYIWMVSVHPAGLVLIV